MSPPKFAFLAAIAATLLLGLAAPAGTAKPSLIRQVHLNGVVGPAYYSVVDGGYRPVRMPTVVDRPEPEEVAEIIGTGPSN